MLIAYLALLGVTVFWGFTFPVVQWSLDDCSPVLFVALRFALAALLFPLFFGKKSLSLDPQLIKRGLCSARFCAAAISFKRSDCVTRPRRARASSPRCMCR
ncbi:MAG: EamA family transporter [bacterium]|nr:EamA family transporter [bacterium]